MAEPTKITDAEFEVVSGPLRVGDKHPTRRDWYFTGQYNAEGDPYFIRGAGWWRRQRWKRRIPLILLIAMGGFLLVVMIANKILPPDHPSRAPGLSREEVIAEARARGLIVDRPQ